MKKTLLLTLMSILFGGATFAQNYQKSLEPIYADMNHYSIECAPSGNFYAYAGTSFYGDNNDMHIFITNLHGDIIWERLIDYGTDDRALDVVVDAHDDIIITGTTNPLGTPQLYVAKFTSAGTMITDYTLGTVGASAGTNIIAIQSGEYIVGGFLDDDATALSNPITTMNKAILLCLPANLLMPSWEIDFAGADQHTSINDIVEIDPLGLIFITGSSGIAGTNDQGVLAATINSATGLMVDNYSFKHNTPNVNLIGVSAEYDVHTDEILLLSNNSALGPQVNKIFGVSAMPGTVGPGVPLNLDPASVQDPAGFQLLTNPLDPTILMVSGYCGNSLLSPGSANFWAVEMDKSTLAPTTDVFHWDPSSVGFSAHGGGVFSTFTGSQPYIYNQEIMTIRADGLGYAVIAPIDAYGNYTLDLFAFEAFLSGVITSCHQNFRNTPIASTILPIPLTGLPSSHPWNPEGQTCHDTRRDQYWVCDIEYSRSPLFTENIENDSKEEISLIKTENRLTVMLKTHEIKTIKVRNISGQLIAEHQVNASVYSQDIAIDSYAPGMYIVTVITNDDLMFNSKFLKE